MDHDFFLIGVDGGGTGTRAVLADCAGHELAQAAGGPSGLGLGVARAWQAIRGATEAAFAAANLRADLARCVFGCGLAGANNPDWLAAFRDEAAGVAGLVVESDAYTTLLGAHGGADGVVVALGTGSVGAAIEGGAPYRLIGGYGFPSGDEASGAWLGLRAVVHAQQALDGRVAADAFSDALIDHTGARDRDSLVVWLCDANQTAYARLAPIVLAHCTHPFAAKLLESAGGEIGKMIDGLDPFGALPVALCGGLGAPLADYVPAGYRARLRAPLADSAHGAVRLAARLAQQIRDGRGGR